MQNLVTTIPLNKVDRIKVYINSGRKNMSQIKRELGCDYIINGGLFNMRSFKPDNTLFSSGIKCAFSPGKVGLSFLENDVKLSYENNVKYPEHVSGYPVLINNGQKAYSVTPPGLEGDRGRSAIGVTRDSLILRAIQDVPGTADFALDELYRDMKNRGCIHAINLDGGGSTQCNFYGNAIYSSRIVHNFICVWLKGSNNTKTVTARTGLNIRQNAPNCLGINTSRVIGCYATGERVTVLESRNGWSRTNRGWVSNAYLK